MEVSSVVGGISLDHALEGVLPVLGEVDEILGSKTISSVVHLLQGLSHTNGILESADTGVDTNVTNDGGGRRNARED